MSFLLNPQRYDSVNLPSFPLVESITGQSFPSSASSWNVTLPTALSGDLLWLHLTTLHSGVFTGPAGWTNLRTPTSINIFSATIADGTEGGTTVNISKTSTATTAASQVIRISNWSGSITDIKSTSSGTIAGESVIGPPGLAPSYGQGSTLWITAMWSQFQIRSLVAYPDDTINQNYQNDGSDGTRAELACATRELNAASWEPSPFELSDRQDFAAAYTFAIKAAA